MCCGAYQVPVLFSVLLTLNVPMSETVQLSSSVQGRPAPFRQPFSYSRDWLGKIGSSNFTYQILHNMLSKHQHLVSKVSTSIGGIQDDERQKQQQQGSVVTSQSRVQLNKRVLGIYQRELKAVENSLEMVLRDLNQTLSSDYHSIENIKRACRLRQEDMRSMAILVEENYNIILQLEKEMMSGHPNTSKTHFSILNQFLSEISHAADALEKELEDNDFSDYKKLKGVKFETVVKLSEPSMHHHSLVIQPYAKDGPQGKDHSKKPRKRSEMSMLIDSASNHYILCRPRDMTVPTEDNRFIHDFVYILLMSMLCGTICSFFRVPSLFGYVFTGMVLGPTGSNTISCIVQVESLGEVGVVFIVFMVGLEFSPQKLQKVWAVAVYGGNLLLLSSIALAIFLGSSFQVDAQHSLFVAACLSFSSNPLASRIVDRESRGGLSRYQKSGIEGTSRKSPELPDSELTDWVVGILMMQDLQLGTLVALLPFFEGWSLPEGVAREKTLVWGWLVKCLQLLQVLFGFPLLVLVFRLCAGRMGDRIHRLLLQLSGHPKGILLGSLALCLSFLLIAEVLGASVELGSFLAGVVLSSLGPAKIDQVKRLVDPIKEVFAVFFFTSLGFHVYPSFLRLEFTTLCIVMVTIVLLKLFLSLAVLGFFLGHCRRRTLVVSVSLAQVSEFSFVLSSRARRIGIISREVYLVILGITTLSLLLSPILWRSLLHLHLPKSFSPLSSLKRTLFGR